MSSFWDLAVQTDERSDERREPNSNPNSLLAWVSKKLQQLPTEANHGRTYRDVTFHSKMLVKLTPSCSIEVFYKKWFTEISFV